MKTPRRFVKEAHGERELAARARRMLLMVPERRDQDRIRRFADEVDHRAAAVEREIKALRAAWPA